MFDFWHLAVSFATRSWNTAVLRAEHTVQSRVVLQGIFFLAVQRAAFSAVFTASASSRQTLKLAFPSSVDQNHRVVVAEIDAWK